jgi:two-component system phosphate regulon sensor histidine kinase PhoR
MAVAALAVAWLLSSAVEREALDRTVTALAAQAGFLSRCLQGEPVTPESAERLAKAAYQATAIRFTVFHPKDDWLVDSISPPRRGIEWPAYPEVEAATGAGVSRRLVRDAYLEERQMAVAVASDPLRPGPGLLIRAVTSLSGHDASMRRLRIVLAACIFGFLCLWGVWGYRLALWFRSGFETVSDGLDLLCREGCDADGPAPPHDEWAGLHERLHRAARAMDHRFEALERRRGALETVLSSMREGVFAVDHEERVVHLNRAAAGMFDRDPEEACGRTVPEVARNPSLHRFVSRATAAEGSLEEDVTLHGGDRVVLNLRSAAMRERDGRRIGTLVVMADVTRLRHLEGMRSDFVANVSHELKTPLTAIKGFVETLYNRQVDSPEETQRFLGIVVKHVDRLDAIVSDLLALSRIEQSRGRKELRLKETRIRDVLTTVLQVVQARAEAKRIDIAIRDAENATALVDPTLLEQALLNLVDNAIKYSDAGGRVEVIAKRQDGEMRIDVSDRGMGIAKAHLPRLFERFYRVDKARSRHLGGTGLGLAIVKHIAQAHGGTVGVNSSPGVGTTFTLRLPAS